MKSNFASKSVHDAFVAPMHSTAMIIPDDVYRELAEKIRIEAEYSALDYATITVEADRNDEVFSVTVSAFFNYIINKCPDTIFREITGLTAVWYECHTYDAAGDERPNNFDIKTLNKLIPW